MHHIFCFSFHCVLLVYHDYTNANIGPWWMGTWLDIFLSTKHHQCNKLSMLFVFAASVRDYKQRNLNPPFPWLRKMSQIHSLLIYSQQWNDLYNNYFHKTWTINQKFYFSILLLFWLDFLYKFIYTQPCAVIIHTNFDKERVVSPWPLFSSIAI